MKPSFTIWWLHPALMFGILSGSLAAAALVIPGSSYQELWFTPKFLDTQSLLAVLACMVAFVTGALLPDLHFRGWTASGKSQPDAELSAHTLLVLFRLAFALALVGYTVWTVTAISRGLNFSILADVIAAKKNVLGGIRTKYLGNIPGVTTCTQFGVAAAVLGPLVAARSGSRKVWKPLVLLFALALVRVILNSERLALFELAVPMVVVVSTQILGPLQVSRTWLRKAIKAAPVGGVGLLFLFFAVFEYFRSWASYYSDDGVSFWQFTATRLIGYYVTAFNNGAYLLQRLSAPMGVPFFTNGFLWRFPLLKDLIESVFPTFQISTNYFDVLQSGANAEFSNGGGLFGPTIDFGSLGAMLYWIAAGLVCGSAYKLFQRGSAWGLCLYPILYLGILDVARGLYWGSGRAIPQLAFLALSAFLLTIEQRRARNVRSLIHRPTLRTTPFHS